MFRGPGKGGRTTYNGRAYKIARNPQVLLRSAPSSSARYQRSAHHLL
jgi:lipocalin